MCVLGVVVGVSRYCLRGFGRSVSCASIISHASYCREMNREGHPSPPCGD